MSDHSRTFRALTIVGSVALAATVALPAVAQASANTVLISKSSSGAKGNGASGEPSLSRSGRFVAFKSASSNLVPNDTNGVYDCFVRDQGSGSTERVSLSSGGAQGNNSCQGPAISEDGRYVAFHSTAGNLVPNDTNGTWDIFVHDRQLDTTVRVSVDSSGDQANGASEDAAISGDGRIITFESGATNLVAGDTNGRRDVFVHDRNTGTTTRVSVRSNGAQAAGGTSRDAAVSANGRFVVFDSGATNLVANDTNGRRDAFIHDRVTGNTQRVSVKSGGKQANGSSGNVTASADGRFVAFDSAATNLVKGDNNRRPDAFVRDRKNGTTVRISVSSGEKQAAGWSFDPTISDNGRYISFLSSASNLVAKDTNGRWDVFLRDRIKKTTKLISVTASGGRTRNGDSDNAVISGDARFVVFASTAPNIVKGDTNGAADIFRRGPVR
jgi:hypothetical protein